MRISRRKRQGRDRWLLVKASILFLASGVWLAGLFTRRETVTALALAVAVIGVIVAAATRQRGGD